MDDKIVLLLQASSLDSFKNRGENTLCFENSVRGLNEESWSESRSIWKSFQSAVPSELKMGSGFL